MWAILRRSCHSIYIWRLVETELIYWRLFGRVSTTTRSCRSFSCRLFHLNLTACEQLKDLQFSVLFYARTRSPIRVWNVCGQCIRITEDELKVLWLCECEEWNEKGKYISTWIISVGINFRRTFLGLNKSTRDLKCVNECVVYAVRACHLCT